MRLEFLQNMIGSDYVFCCRGAGTSLIGFMKLYAVDEFQFSLIQTVSYDFMIDWKKYFVWVDQSELPLIAKK